MLATMIEASLTPTAHHWYYTLKLVTPAKNNFLHIGIGAWSLCTHTLDKSIFFQI